MQAQRARHLPQLWQGLVQVMLPVPHRLHCVVVHVPTQERLQPRVGLALGRHVTAAADCRAQKRHLQIV